MSSQSPEAYVHHTEKIDEKYRSDMPRSYSFLNQTSGESIPKATSPREAAEQSAEYYALVKQDDETLRHNAKVRLLNDRVYAEKLPEAETTLLFAQNFKYALEEIRAEEDPAIRQTLWEDALSLQSQYSSPHFVWGETTHAYTGKSALENDFKHQTINDAQRAFALRIYGSEEAVREADPFLLYNFVRNTFDTPQTNGPEGQNLRNLYESKAREFSRYGDSIPDYGTLPAEAWSDLQRSIDTYNEFLQYDGQAPISLDLSEQLTGRVDQYLKKFNEYVVWATDKVEKHKAAAAMTDEEIEIKAHEDFLKEKNPFIDAATEHARRHLSLLKRAALAEAALDGVKINTRRTAKKND